MCLSLAWLRWPPQLQPRPNRQSINNRYGNDNIEILSHNSDDRHPQRNSFSSLLPRADVTYCSFLYYYLHPWYFIYISSLKTVPLCEAAENTLINTHGMSKLSFLQGLPCLLQAVTKISRVYKFHKGRVGTDRRWQF